ncbi:hypothetical protein CWE13_09515 [Aliidiomarina shirensis]|uniref:Uncharacterized protein n=2 Tax=Aliidiomarina shirensis TaxID=1048642 RepID=A0A432WR44_9GAMM|nr:hypothetical protein CWE13_09515 [Aliidiomarina shirensis]
MVSNPDLINNVLKGQHHTEYFFKYENKHNWSIFRNHEGVYYLQYYPGEVDLSDLAGIPDQQWEEAAPESVAYNTKDLATKEAVESFRDLYAIVKEKVYGMDEVLDDIIGGNIPF